MVEIIRRSGSTEPHFQCDAACGDDAVTKASMQATEQALGDESAAALAAALYMHPTTAMNGSSTNTITRRTCTTTTHLHDRVSSVGQLERVCEHS